MASPHTCDTDRRPVLRPRLGLFSASSTGCGAWPFATVAECVCCRGIGSPSTEPIRRSSRRWPHNTVRSSSSMARSSHSRDAARASPGCRAGWVSPIPREHCATGIPVFYYMFDLIHLDAFTTTDLPLSRRKRLLRDTFQFTDPLRYTTHRVKNGEAAYTAACRRGDEGVIAKRADAPYEGRRSANWLKFKCSRARVVHRRLYRPEGQSRRTGRTTARVLRRRRVDLCGQGGNRLRHRDAAQPARTAVPHRTGQLTGGCGNGQSTGRALGPTDVGSPGGVQRMDT